MTTVFSQYTGIYEAIKAQDKDLARHLMREHLFGTNKKLSDFFREKKIELL
jgi:DNA-binding FadR family transcriptional regulator